MVPSLRTWRRHIGHTAWPTLLLAAATLTVWCSSILAHAMGLLPTPIAAALTLVAAYVSFTPLHEATHDNVGAKGQAWLDEVVGWASAIPLLAPYPAFRGIHLRHHAKTNHPEHDPDMWASGTGLALAGRCLTIMVHYYKVYLGSLARSSDAAAKSRPVAIGYLLAQAGVLTSAAALGFASTVVWVVIVPGWLATALLALLFDWLPHHPHTVQGRYIDTRAIPSRVLEVLLLGQNLHLVHHLWPSVPWYRYGVVFREAEHALRAKGSPIVDLEDAGLPRLLTRS